LNRFHIFDIHRRSYGIFVKNSRHSEQIVWRSGDAVRTLQVETHQLPGGWATALSRIKTDFPNARWFEREMEQKEYR
jgi:hypothetical protein